MAFNRLAILTLSLVAAAALGAAAAERADFDAGPRVDPLLKEARTGAEQTPEASGKPIGVVAAKAAADSVWLSFDPRDLSTLRKAGLLPAFSAEENKQAALFQVSADLVPKLSAFMHETYHRCGGFFAHATKAQAEKDMTKTGARTAETFVIDQQAWTRPLLSRVKEENLRSTIESLAAYNNRFYTADSGVAAAKWIKSRWQGFADKIPGATTALISHDGWKQPSVVLTIPGTDKADEIVVLGGHLDSINGWGNESARAPGADDNASGIAVLTETARILAEAGFHPRRTVQFMGYAAEEVGLRGSQDIAERYAADGKKVVAVIQYDMTNFKGSADEIYLLQDNVDPGLTAFLGQLIDTYLGVKRNTLECGYACSDHASWTKSGYPSACAFESSFDEMNHHIHTADDTLSNSGGNAAHSVSFAKLAVAFAAETAKASGSASAAFGAK